MACNSCSKLQNFKIKRYWHFVIINRCSSLLLMLTFSIGINGKKWNRWRPFLYKSETKKRFNKINQLAFYQELAKTVTCLSSPQIQYLTELGYTSQKQIQLLISKTAAAFCLHIHKYHLFIYPFKKLQAKL